MARALARTKEKSRDMKAGARNAAVSKAERFGLTPVTGHLIMQDTPPCRPEVVRDLRRLV
jgi:hypothetical protein